MSEAEALAEARARAERRAAPAGPLPPARIPAPARQTASAHAPAAASGRPGSLSSPGNPGGLRARQLGESRPNARPDAQRNVPGNTPPGTRQNAALLAWPHDPTADRAALGRLAELCEEFSPAVGWETLGECKNRGASGGAAGKGNGGIPSRGVSSRSNADTGKSDAGQTGVGHGSGERGGEPAQLYLDITGIGRLFGGERPLAAGVIERCRQLGYGVRVAVADTPGAAWACATSEPPGRSPASADSWGEPVIVPPGGTREALGPLPVSALRIPQAAVELLAQLGVTRIGQLDELPRDALTARFGAELLWRLDQAVGRIAEVIVPHRPSPKYQVERSWEEPTSDREQLALVLREQLERLLSESMAPRGEGLLQLSARFDCAPGRPLILRVGLYQPTASLAHLWPLVELQLERCQWPGAAGRLTVSADLTAPLETRQRTLFAEVQAEAETSREVCGLFERLSSRLGAQAVLQPRLSRDPLPELAIRFTPLVGRARNGVERSSVTKPTVGRRSRASSPSVLLPSSALPSAALPSAALPGDGVAPSERNSSAASSSAAGSPTSSASAASSMLGNSKRRWQRRGVNSAGASSAGTHAAETARGFTGDFARASAGNFAAAGDERLTGVSYRPLRLQQPPAPLEVLALAPDGPPLAFRCPPGVLGAGETLRVERRWGPERIETGWWRGPTVRRDYYRVEATNGLRLWLFRDRADGRWFLHGVFE